jgi:hypothetical protein
MRRFNFWTINLGATRFPLSNNDRAKLQGFNNAKQVAIRSRAASPKSGYSFFSPYQGELPAWCVLLSILVLVISACSNLNSPANKMYTATFSENIDEKEALWLEVAEGTDIEAKRARSNLVELYEQNSPASGLQHYGKKADAQKEWYWRIKEVEHPMYRGIYEYDGKYKTLRGHQEERIADMFRDGRGTAKNLDQACIWYEKSFHAGNRALAEYLAKNCALNTKVGAAIAEDAKEKARQQAEAAKEEARQEALKQILRSPD